MSTRSLFAGQASSLLALFGMALLFVLISGCGGSSDSSLLRIDGSSTVYPLTEAVSEEFMQQNQGSRVIVGVSGTGGGFSKFLRKETEITNASRPIAASEVQLANQNNVQYIELPVAYDGIAVVTHPSNDFVDCLTVSELRQIWQPDSEINNWNEVRSSFPDEPLHLYGAGTDSGTYDYFTAAIVGEEGASRSDFTASEDDNVLVQGVAGDPNALGFVPLAYYEENANKLKLLGIDDNNPNNGKGCVKPSPETVNNGRYQPLARPLFIYVRASQADEAAIQNYVTFYLNHAAELAPSVGYVPLSEEAYNLALQRFRNRVTGSMFAEEGAIVGVRMADLLAREQASHAATDTISTDTTSAQ